MDTYEITISGVRPFLMHAAGAVNPLSTQAKAAKAVSSIRKKTEADHAKMAEMDWLNSFYKDNLDRPVVPADSFLGSLISGAKKLRLKGDALSSIDVVDDALLTGHGHPAGSNATILDFWSNGVGPFVDVRGVRVQNARIMRYRPRFNHWKATFQIFLSGLDSDRFLQIARTAGESCGIGDYRPRFGLYEISRFERS